MLPDGADAPRANSAARASIAEDLGRQAIEEIRREILADPPLPHVVFDTLNVESDGVSPHIEAFRLANQLFHIAWLESDPQGYLTTKPEDGHPYFRPLPTTPLEVSSDCWRKISDVLGEADRKIESWSASRDRTNAIHLLASKASIRRPDLAQRIRKVCDSSGRLAQLASQLLFAAQETRGDCVEASNEESPVSKADPNPVDKESDRQTSAPLTVDKPSVTVDEARERLERIANCGEPYTSQRQLADDLGCSLATVNKAIAKSTKLRTWMATGRRTATVAVRLDDIITDSVHQTRESAPDSYLPDDDVDKIIRKLVAEAPKDRREETRQAIANLDADSRRQIAQVISENPEYGQIMWPSL